MSDLVTSGWILYVETISYKNQVSVSEALEYLLDGMIVYAVEDRKRKAVMLRMEEEVLKVTPVSFC